MGRILLERSRDDYSSEEAQARKPVALLMVREWGASGAGFGHKVTLSSESRQQIDDVLSSRGIPTESAGAFYEAINKGLGLFHLNCEIAKASSPKAVRRNLNVAREAALDFQMMIAKSSEAPADLEKRNLIMASRRVADALGQLDENSRQLLRSVVVGGPAALFNELARVNESVCLGTPILSTRVFQALQAATELANDYPMRGRRVENHRSFLTADVADAIEKYLGERVTGTRESIFEELLSIIMADALGRSDALSAVHSLIERHFKHQVKRTNPDGTIEYVSDKNNSN